ncbi:hypothetical protein Xcc1_36280 [Xanthomonas campestris pv. campestris]|nr:hypothetical protein Xcc1_36280 [Xanthomonas campestris pv. campestris]
MEDAQAEDQVALIVFKAIYHIFHRAVLKGSCTCRVLGSQRLAHIDVEIEKIHAVYRVTIGCKVQREKPLGTAKVEHTQRAAKRMLQALRALADQHKPVLAPTRAAVGQLRMRKDRLVLLWQGCHKRPYIQ